jgi:DNA sulfur modification protein DndB
MIIAVADGEPQFSSIKIVEPTLPHARIENLGLLTFDGSQKYFALDGQHRLSGIKNAILKKPSLGEEVVSVIFVPHRHDEHPKLGWSRTRRLFTTLNRYAKQISKKDAIVMDEDDSVAIVTRNLIQEFSLFKGKRLLLSNSKSINPKDDEAFTNIITVYDVNEIVLGLKWQINKSFKQKLRPLDEIEDMYKTVKSFWLGLSESILPIREIKNNPELPIAEELRSKNGGHLLFRPIGLTTYAKVFRLARQSGLSEVATFRGLALVNFNLSTPPWSGVIWHPGNHKMLARAENQHLADGLLAYLIRLKTDKRELLKVYRNMLSTTGRNFRGKLPKRVPVFRR